MANAAPVARPAAQRRLARRLLQQALRRHHRQKEEECEGEVRGDERPVGEHVRAERREERRGERRRAAEAPLGDQEHGDHEARGERHHRKPPQEQQPVAVVPAIEEAPPELPLPRLGPGDVRGLDLGPERDERRGREQLHERRLLRIQAVVEERQVRVAGRQVGAFVERRRAAAHRVDAQAHLERHGGRHEAGAGRAAHGRAGAGGRATTSSTARAIACAAMRWAISLGCSSFVPSTTSSRQSTLA